MTCMNYNRLLKKIPGGIFMKYIHVACTGTLHSLSLNFFGYFWTELIHRFLQANFNKGKQNQQAKLILNWHLAIIFPYNKVLFGIWNDFGIKKRSKNKIGKTIPH